MSPFSALARIFRRDEPEPEPDPVPPLSLEDQAVARFNASLDPLRRWEQFAPGGIVTPPDQDRFPH